ncbi:MAG: DUF4998 domain-containing protein [Prevotellaceae bacterium]|jgi:hypothetical protein|nr:DUF4998 domain-containing protein [Prevotellaceae bacterium]
MKLIIKNLTLLMMTLATISCGDIYETHRKYLDMGEETYIGMADSMKVNGGLNRVEIKWKLNSDPKINKCLITWGNDSPTIEVPISDLKADMSKIIDIAEGNYIFKIVVISASGKKSLEQTSSGSSYGESYIARLPQRVIKAIAKAPEGAKITWSPEEGCVGIKIEYKDAAENEQTISFGGADASNLIPNFKPDTEFKVYTLFKPEKEAIDTIPSKPETHRFPA